MITSEQAYLQVVESGSFKQAAACLGVEASSLSRKVAALESRLQVQLLHRSTVRCQPTALGESYYHRLRRIMDEQLVLENEISSGKVAMNGKMRVGSTADFGEKFLVPAILQLKKAAPELSVELWLSSDVDNLIEKGIDVAFRFGPLSDSSLYARHVGEISRILVASPDYLKRKGLPNSKDALRDHQFVLYSQSQAKVDIEFKDGSVFSHQDIQCRMMANSVRAIRELVLGGEGIHWGPKWLYEDDLAANRVVKLLPDQPVCGFSIFAVYTGREFQPKKIGMYIDLVADQIAKLSE